MQAISRAIYLVAWLLVVLLAFIHSGTQPLLATEPDQARYLALRDAKNAMCAKEADLKRQRDELLQDISELSDKLKLKLQKLDTVYNSLKAVDINIKQIEKDML